MKSLHKVCADFAYMKYNYIFERQLYFAKAFKSGEDCCSLLPSIILAQGSILLKQHRNQQLRWFNKGKKWSQAF